MKDITISTYQWIENQVDVYFQFIKVIHKKQSGEILLYKHKGNGRYIIVKKLKGEFLAYERLLDIKQENLPVIYEVVYESGNSIILEEYIEGMPISFYLETKTFSLKEMSKLAIQICDGLYALHKNRIIHRDIKPENVMMMPNGTAKIIDFDVAKIHKPYVEKDTKMLGTIGYAAPEQYGEKQSTEKTDIYALGVLMNVMLTGKHPSSRHVEGRVGNIIEKCIMVVPDKRYNSVLEVKEKLKKLVY